MKQVVKGVGGTGGEVGGGQREEPKEREGGRLRLVSSISLGIRGDGLTNNLCLANHPHQIKSKPLH